MTAGAETEPPAPAAGAVLGGATAPPRDLRSVVQRSYERYHRRLEGGDHARHTRFMNFGYDPVPGRPDHNALHIGRLLPNAEAARLVGEIIGSVALDAQVVVDVGCGRGGALWLATTEQTPRLAFGFDLSPAGARAAETTLRDRVHATAGVADAESLPLGSSMIDVVLSVESSLHYPHLERFHAEVARVLRPGGTFCYGDLFHVAAGDAYTRSLEACGLAVELERDVTENVLAARRARAQRQRRALDRRGPGGVGDDNNNSAAAVGETVGDWVGDAARFVAEPGTPFFDAMDHGTWTYRLIRARRTAATATVAAADPRLRTAARLAQDLTGEFDADG